MLLRNMLRMHEKHFTASAYRGVTAYKPERQGSGGVDMNRLLRQFVYKKL